MSPQFKAAFGRALIGALIGASGVFFTTLGTDADWKTIISATGVAFFGFAGFRALGEGMYDTHRADTGDIHAGDVGAHRHAPPVGPRPGSSGA